jgi:hypothetical protein
MVASFYLMDKIKKRLEFSFWEFKQPNGLVESLQIILGFLKIVFAEVGSNAVLGFEWL